MNKEIDQPFVVNFLQYMSKAKLDEAFGDKWLYIGRESEADGLKQSPLGNMYTLEEYERAEAIKLYKVWLWDQLQQESAIRTYLDSIAADAVLVCWCKPLGCHGDIVLAAWKWLKRGSNMAPGEKGASVLDDYLE